MEIQQILLKDQKDVKNVLQIFVENNTKVYEFKGLSENGIRKDLWNILFKYLVDKNLSDLHVISLATIRILSRDKTDLDRLLNEERLNLLVEFAGLKSIKNIHNYSNDDLLLEALKCLCNLTYNSKVANEICSKNNCVEGLINRTKLYRNPSFPVNIKVLDMKILFLISAFCDEIRTRLKDELDGIKNLMEVLEYMISNQYHESDANKGFSAIETDVVSECLKILFNVTIETDDDDDNEEKLKKEGNKNEVVTVEVKKEQQEKKEENRRQDTNEGKIEEKIYNEQKNERKEEKINQDKEKDDEKNIPEREKDKIKEKSGEKKRKKQEVAQYMHLVSILKKLLFINSPKKMELDNHIINLLTNIPNQYYKQLIIPVQKHDKIPKDQQYEGQNMKAVYQLYLFLENRVSSNEMESQQELLAPVLTALLKAIKSSRPIRKYLRLKILPPLKDVHNRPEEGNSVRNCLCRLLTTPISFIHDLTAELLFVLCKENVNRMIKYTGYGNAAGLFAQRGLLEGNQSNGSQYSSDSEDSDTEEYQKYRHGINPVTGCYEPPHPSPTANMTEEQREYEAMKLVNLIDNLTRKGIVQPCKIGEDGRPQPIEHVLELQESLPNQQIHRNNKENSNKN